MKILLIILACLSLWIAPALANHVYVNGDVSGTWNVDTVIVTGEVRVPPRETLIIEPGVKVLFQDNCKFIVDTGAVLHAIGTVSDTILFDEYIPGNHWKGIRFIYASDSSRLEYCHVAYGRTASDECGGAILIRCSSPTIKRCTITGCSSVNCGGGIACLFSNPVITHNSIIGNVSEYYGGGICCWYSNPTISDNLISENIASNNGGGIACVDSSAPIIASNTISGNTANGNGGGIFCENDSSPTITGNTISGNTTAGSGAGILCNYSSPTISGNLISGNTAGWNGGAICCWEYTHPTINGNTLSRNSGVSGGGIFCDHANPTITNDTISGNTARDGGGIFCNYSSPNIQNCLIDSCSADTYGGGITCSDNSHPSIRNNVVSRNTAGESGGGIITSDNSNPVSISRNRIVGNMTLTHGGGGLYLQSTPDTFNLNEISGNTAATVGGGIRTFIASPAMNKNTIACNHATSGGGLYLESSGPSLLNCILWGNTASTDPMIYQTEGSSATITYSCLQDTFTGEGNLWYCDPLFVDTCDNVHLQWGSPCIDSGNPDTVYNDPDGTRADMGCYYFGYHGSFAVLEPCSLNFLTVEPGHPMRQYLFVRNLGSDWLHIYSVTTYPPYAISSYQSDVPPNSTGNIEVTFDPPGNGQFMDTLFIACNASNADTLGGLLNGWGEVGLQPAPVSNLIIQTGGADAHLAWDRVHTTAHGNPIFVDNYLVYNSRTAGGPFYYFGCTSDTSYLHRGVVRFSPTMFYFVESYVGSISRVSSLAPGITREEVARRLQR